VDPNIVDNIYMDYQKLFAYGPFPIRILAGITFTIHGLPKLLNIAGSEVFFGKMGLPPWQC
jgi:putative oxidoreductase